MEWQVKHGFSEALSEEGRLKSAAYKRAALRAILISHDIALK